MTQQRTCHPARVATVGLLLGMLGLVGCGSGSPPAGKTQNTGSEKAPLASIPGSKPSTPESAAPPTESAVRFAGEFLTSLRDGKANPTQLTPAFKKIIAEPITEADRSQGYSDWATEQWLQAIGKRVGQGSPAAIPLGSDSVIVTVAPSATAGRTALRVIRSGTAWLVDWLHVAPAGVAIEFTGSGEVLAARWATATFLEPALAGETRLAEAALSAVGKAKLAPPLGGDDTTRGYNRGILGVKLSAFRGGAVGATLSRIDGSSATGDLLGVGGDRRTFTLKLVPGSTPDLRLVDDFDPK